MDTKKPDIIDRFNEAAEQRFVAIETQDDIDYHRRKPFGDIVEGRIILYKFALMLAALDLKEGQRVLDFGTGTGWVARMLNQMGLLAVGVDISNSAVLFARETTAADPYVRRDLPIEFVTYDGYRLSFDDSCFDRIACFDTFHHIPNKQQVLAELHRVLVPGGRIAFVEPGPHHHKSDQAKIETSVHGVLEDSVSLADMMDLAHGVGFGNVEILPYPPENRLRFDLKAFTAFMQGDQKPYRLSAVREDLRHAFIVAFTKGAPVNGSLRRPWWRFWG